MKPKVGVHGVVEIKTYDYGSFEDRKSEDFDFACSPTFREYYTEQYGYPSQRREIDKPTQESVPYKAEPKLMRTIIREYNETKARIDLMESDVSGLKKNFHSHTDKKRKSKYD